ncbi:MAG: DUF971 domain-containing protein [Phycisphaerales bacterium]|nr:DUF971 domain-containing protein [Phycisphaerales bacterium]
MTAPPRHLELDRAHGLIVHWADGRVSAYPTEHLRRFSPSAEARQLREELERNPLAVLPASANSDVPLHAVDAELVGTYAVRIRFSDGHDTGIYSWDYLRSIDPDAPPRPDEGGPDHD